MTTYRIAGVDVPRIGLGTNRLTSAREHVTFVREAVAAGVRHIDTAHLYTGGESERAIGEALAGVANSAQTAKPAAALAITPHPRGRDHGRTGQLADSGRAPPG